MKEKIDWKKELIQTLKILQDNGVDISEIKIKNTVDGKRRTITLREINQQGVNIEDIIAQNQLDGDFDIGNKLHARTTRR